MGNHLRTIFTPEESNSCDHPYVNPNHDPSSFFTLTIDEVEDTRNEVTRSNSRNLDGISITNSRYTQYIGTKKKRTNITTIYYNGNEISQILFSLFFFCTSTTHLICRHYSVATCIYKASYLLLDLLYIFFPNVLLGKRKKGRKKKKSIIKLST